MPNAVGWVTSLEASAPDMNHFGDDDIYSGPYGSGIYLGAFQFRLPDFLKGAAILGAEVEMTGQTTAYLGTGGQWKVQLLDKSVDTGWEKHGYTVIANAVVSTQVGPTLERQDLGVLKVNLLGFAPTDLWRVAERVATTGLISFRVDGPTAAPNNAFSWDAGNVVGGEGYQLPPKLRVWFVPPTLTPTPTGTLTTTPTPTATPGRTATPTLTATQTPTVMPSPTGTALLTPSPTPAATLVLYCWWEDGLLVCRQR